MYSTALLLSLVAPLASAAAVKRQSLDITVGPPSRLCTSADRPSRTTEVQSHGHTPLAEVSHLLMRPMHHAVVNRQAIEPTTH